jgi:N-acetylglucosamine kinase-like BadF-type ATPase
MANAMQKGFLDSVLRMAEVPTAVELFERIESLRSVQGSFGVRKYLFDLGVLVLKLADSSDAFADLLVSRAQEHLIVAARLCTAGLTSGNRIPVCLRGGMLENSSRFSKTLLERLLREVKQLTVLDQGLNGAFSPLIGLVLLALDLHKPAEIHKQAQHILTRYGMSEWGKPQMPLLPSGLIN